MINSIPPVHIFLGEIKPFLRSVVARDVLNAYISNSTETLQ